MAAKGKKAGKKKDEGSGSSLKLEHIIVGLVVVGGAFFVFSSRSSQMPAVETSSASPQAAVAGKAPSRAIQALPTDSAPMDVKAYQQELDKKRAMIAAATQLGIKSLSLQEEGNNFVIPFQFTPRKVWCQGGDLDTMKYASNNPAATTMLVTIEPLSSRTKGDSLKTSVMSLFKGINHTFKIKKTNESESYALYICSDVKGEGSCKGKTLKTHAQLSDELADKATAAAAGRKDYLFYFQHLVLNKKQLHAYRTNEFTASFKKSIGDYLQKQMGVAGGDFQNAWKVSDVTRSAPADVEGGKIVLSLPYNDPRCLGLGKGPEEAR